MTGESLFLDGGVPHLAARYTQCYGSGGCDDDLFVIPWDGDGFGTYLWEDYDFVCCRNGVASSSVTVRGTGFLFIGGVEHEVDEWVELDTLVMVEGPFT